MGLLFLFGRGVAPEFKRRWKVLIVVGSGCVHEIDVEAVVFATTKICRYLYIENLIYKTITLTTLAFLPI